MLCLFDLKVKVVETVAVERVSTLRYTFTDISAERGKGQRGIIDVGHLSDGWSNKP